MKKIICLLLSLMMIAGVSVGFTEAQPEGALFTPGTYESSEQGLFVPVKVQITVSENEITNVLIDATGETPELGGAAASKLAEEILNQQTPNVDALSGATVTSQAIIKAATAALEQAGADIALLDANKREENKVIEKAEITDNKDLVIIGAGGAGMAAAIMAQQAGLNFAILEKMPYVGGNTTKATGGMNAAETHYQAEQGITDSKALFAADTMKGGHALNDPELVATLANSSAEAIDWLDTIGAELPKISFSGGASVNRIHAPEDGSGVGSYLVDRFSAKLEELGVSVLLNTEATEILVDANGVVCGVKAESPEANYTFNCPTVILATGGFGANEAMYTQYRPDLKGTVTTNAPGATGDGIIMAQKLGADLVDIEQIQLHPTVEQTTSMLITESVRGDGAILVNQKGERFVNELLTRDAVSAAELEQEGQYAYIIFDQNLRDHLKAIEKYVKANLTVQADTIEGLAEQLAIDPATLAKTLADWNEIVKNQRDTQFGRTTGMNADLTTPPYYAIKVAPGIHHTMGGIKIDTEAQVINTEGKPIPGLFAAGEVTGGVHGGNRLGGNAVADIVIFGRIAAQSAISYLAGATPAADTATSAEAPAPAASAGTFIPGTYEGTGKGFSETDPVTVKVTVDENAITGVIIDGVGEQPFGVPQFDTYAAALVGRTDGEIDAVAGATMTRDGITEAVNKALAEAKGESAAPAGDASLTFAPGEYTATTEGYNGPLTVKVTYSATALEAITIESSVETQHVGDVAFDIMIPEMIAAGGAGVDGVSGATFSTRALRNAVIATAEEAGCSNLDAFKAAKIDHPAGAPVELEYDVVVVGAGGAGISAAAQAAQDGHTVLVIEKNAEVGGNTLVSGGQYQSVMPYLVWDPADPDATTGVYAHDGQTYEKVKSVQGCIDELKMILNWSEEPFDEDYYKDHEFVAGDAAELSKHGVHAEYLPILQELKKEIQAYLDWAQPKLDAGTAEGQLTLFSTLNLHIFQTYYGGLRQSADKSQWVYGNVDLVSQFIRDGQGLKEWLEDQGATFHEDTQPTLIGALWYRENEFIGSTIDLDGDGNPEMGRWGSYFAAPMSTLYKANEKNNIMIRTTVTGLITEDGRVTGVKAKYYDGTEITVKASKGVVLATGGFAANLPLVLSNNVYWSTDYISETTKTTNRSSLQGDGIAMAEAVGAATTGMGFTQMMPISWIDNGNLAFGGGNYACWINPVTGHRFVDEGSERDVLSLAEFRNGIEMNGTKGTFLEFYNAEQMMPAPTQLADGDYEGRYYRRTIKELPELFQQLGIEADPEVVIDTIRKYDAAVMGQGEYPDVGKAIASRTIGNVQKDENGKYLPETYDLDNALLTIRLMAPSTHHTMGGISVDIHRHVLDTNGNIIPGLYAAGEVTGGIHGGNRLGGNAIVEIFVSGRTAAQAITADNQ